jgi:hypothetical protein
MPLSRRQLFGGLAALAAPAIIRTPGLLMPIHAHSFPRVVVWIDSGISWRRILDLVPITNELLSDADYSGFAIPSDFAAALSAAISS